jgi:hypothetical protein
MNYIASATNETYEYATYLPDGRLVRIWHHSPRNGINLEDWYVTNADDEDMADGWCAFEGEIGPVRFGV